MKNLIMVVLLFLASVSAFVYTYKKYDVKEVLEYDKNDYYVLKGTFNLLDNTLNEYALNWGKGERFTKKFTYVEMNLASLKNNLSTREYDLYYKLMARCINTTEELLSLKSLVGYEYDKYKEKHTKISKEASIAFKELEEIL